MDLTFSQQDETFRDEVRQFFAEKLTADMRRAAARVTTVFADRDLATLAAYPRREGLGSRRLAGGVRRTGLERDAALHLRG